MPLTWTDGLGATWYLADVCITDETGGCLLADLPEQTYVLVERSAPDGYGLLPAPVYVSSYDLDGAELTLHRAVPNTYGYELPQTDGVSTLPFYLCGAALFGLAIRLLILALRRARHVRT